MSERNYNRSYERWSDSPQERRSDDRDESHFNPRWNRSMNNKNKISEEEEVTETLHRTRKLIRGRRRIKDSSDSETRHQFRIKWQLSDDQQREADNRLLSFSQNEWDQIQTLCGRRWRCKATAFWWKTDWPYQYNFDKQF